MVRTTIQYNALLDQLRAARRELGSFRDLGEEAKLRAVRQYGIVQRDLDTQRTRILAVYEGLIAASCEPFNLEGYDKTVAQFRRVSDAEREALSQANRGSASEPVGTN